MVMVFPFLIGIGFGFVLSIPPGPIGVAVMKQALNGRRRQSILLGGGAAIMDLLYVLLGLQFTAALTQSFQHYVSQHSLWFLLFQLVAVALLIGYGIVNLKVRRVRLAVGRKPRRVEFVERLTQRFSMPLLVGIILALANLANPTFIPSLLYVAVFVQDMQFVAHSVVAHFAFSLGFGVGVLLWIAVLTEIFLHLRDRISPGVLELLHRFAGLTLIGLGTYLGYRVVTVVRWTEVLRFAF